MMNLFEKLNRLDDSLVESKRVVKKKKLTESMADDEYEIDGEEMSWPEYFEYMMEEDENFIDENLFSDFADKAYELVEAEGFTDVFTEPSTQAGRGGDFFWAKKDGVAYRGYYDFESEQELFYDVAVNASSREEAIENLAKTYANLILNSLDADDGYDDDIDEMLTEAELTPWEKLAKTFPDDFGRQSTHPANKIPAQHKTMNDYARDPSSPKYAHSNRTANKSNPEDTARQKLRKTFSDLDI